jgi:type I restriction enzyme S subunit
MKGIEERNNMEEWKEIKISDICTRVTSGGTPKSTIAEYYGGSIPWLNTKEVNFNRIYKTEKFITDLGLENSSAKLIATNSIVVAMYGATAGKSAIIKIPLTTNQACCNLTIDPTKADYRFVYYALYNDYDRLASFANGGAQQNLNAQQIKDFHIPYPSLEKQKRIVNILSSLDDKIELNNRINANLEEQAQALFGRWFVDFEFPNEQGLPYKSNGGKFVDSELGKIPEEWKVGNLFSVATLFDSKRKPLSNIQRASRKGEYPYYGATSVMDYVDDYLFDGTFLLMGEDGSVVNEQGYPFLQYVTGKFWVNNHAHIMQGKNGFSTEMLYCMMKMTNISNLVTGAVQAKLSQTNMNKILFPLATKDILKYFSIMIEPLYALLRKNVYENQTLIQLRDLLLPKLMNGEIKWSINN